MNATKHAVLLVFFTTMQKGKTHYSKASVGAIRKILPELHGIRAERRWIFQALRDIEDAGIIRRQKRYTHNAEGEVRQLSSMVAFTLKGVRYLVTQRIEGAKQFLQRMLAWLTNLDKRFPQTGPHLETFTALDVDKNRKRLKQLLYEIG